MAVSFEYPVESVSASPVRRHVVLVVEDDILSRLAIADFLRDCGYAVIEAVDAAEAQGVFASGEPVDLVFTDVQMPGPLDGLGLARWLRVTRADLPVLLTSGAVRTDPEFAVTNFFAKPYSYEAVAARIDKLLGGS